MFCVWWFVVVMLVGAAVAVAGAVADLCLWVWLACEKDSGVFVGGGAAGFAAGGRLCHDCWRLPAIRSRAKNIPLRKLLLLRLSLAGFVSIFEKRTE